MAVGTVANEIYLIAGLYGFREADEVRVFLKRHPELFDLLEETRPEIDRSFGDHVRGVFLESHYDVEDRRERLVIKIQVDLNVAGAIEYLRRFDQAWWSSSSDPYFGDIQAMTEWTPGVQA